jgi:hypothetical protein
MFERIGTSLSAYTKEIISLHLSKTVSVLQNEIVKNIYLNLTKDIIALFSPTYNIEL